MLTCQWGDGGRIDAVDSFNDDEKASFEDWESGDYLWRKCGQRHSIKLSSSGGCVSLTFVLVHCVLHASISIRKGIP